VIITKDVMTKEHQLLPEAFQFKKGVSEIYKHNNGYHVALTKDVLPKGNKTLAEAKGFVVTAYQEELEKKWLKSLRNTYKVSINKEALETIKKSVKQ
jgi:peptidyl-prolyl cis-trans isomerase SurA